jgi:hypothetical protein
MKAMTKMQGIDNKLFMKDTWRQERKESARLDRQAELQLQLKQMEILAQADANKLELRKERLIVKKD